MDGPNQPCFQSMVILGLKRALFEAQDEINRITKERDEARKKILQVIQTNGKIQVEVIKSNELATKLKTELKKVRKELEDGKLKLEETREENERDNVNWSFKYNELKSLLDIKTELLESLNIKGDKANKEESIDYRANFKMLMKNLKIVVKNRPCFPDNELIQDIRNMLFKAENGKSITLSKYLAKRMRPVQKTQDECCNSDDDKNSVEILDDTKNSIPPSMSLSSCFTNDNGHCSEKIDPNTSQRNSSTKTEDLYDPNSISSTNTSPVREKTIETKNELQNEPCRSVAALNQTDEKDIDAISDSESDSTSGFCDGETEVESPSNIDLANHPQSTPYPENHTLAMCMPDLLSSIHTEKNTTEGDCCTESSIDCSSINSEPSDTVLNLKLKNDIKSHSPQRNESNSRNDHDVRSVLEEMKHMRNAMIEKISSLKQFRDDDLVEMNNCFKRPESVPFSHRKSVQKIRKNIEDPTDFIPKRSTQLVKRDPSYRKLKTASISDAIDEVSNSEPDKKLEVRLSNERKESQGDSLGKSNSVSEAIDRHSTKNREVHETLSLSIENSSLLSNVTSCFEKPIKFATEPSRLITEFDVRDTIIDLKDAFDEANFSKSDHQEAVKEFQNVQTSCSLHNTVSETANLTVVQQTESLENPRVDTLLSVKPASDSNEFVRSRSIKKSPDFVSEENYPATTKCVDIVSSETSPTSIDVNPDVLTKEDHGVANDLFTDNISSSVDMSNEKVISSKNSTNESLFGIAKLKEVSCNDQLNELSTYLENDLNSTPEVISLVVQEPVNETEGAISVGMVDDQLNVNLRNTVDKSDSPNISVTSERSVDLSASKLKRMVTSPRKSVPEMNMLVNSPTSSSTTNEKVLMKIPKKRGRPKKASIDLKSKDNLPKSASINRKSERKLDELRSPKISTGTKSVNHGTLISKTLIDCDNDNEKVIEKVPKKPGRPKKSSSDIQDKLDNKDIVITSRDPKPSRNLSALRSKVKEISETLNESSVLRNNTVVDCDLTEREISGNTPKKRRSVPPRKASSLAKSEPKNTSSSTELKTDDFKTTRSGRRWCTIDSCKTEPATKNATSSDTMNNGMQRRKRKGKYSDILDSLKSKSKRSKSDYGLASFELDEVIKPNQCRGRKRKTSLPVETFDNATQTNWSPHSESVVSQIINGVAEIETVTEAGPERDIAFESTSLNIKNTERIEQPSSTVGTNIEKSIDMKRNGRIPINFESGDNVAQSEGCMNPENCPLPSSCHLVTSTRHNLLHQLIDDMSKIIREKVSSIVMESSVVPEHENFDQPKSIPIAVIPSLVHDSSTEPSISEEPFAKLKEHVPNSPNLSEELHNHEQSSPKHIVKTASQPETTPIEVFYHPNQTETDFIAESQRKQVPSSFNSPTRTEHGKNSVTKSSSLKELNSESNRTSSESENDESITKTTTPGRKRFAKLMANSSSKSQSDEESVSKSPTNLVKTATVAKSKRGSVDSLASETENLNESSFNFENKKSPIEILRENISSPTQHVFTDCKRTDSDDDSPLEISSKIITLGQKFLQDVDRSKDVPKIISKIRYEEEASNASSLSSRVSELDANTELISQFENIRTPPKVKNLFDSSDDENSKSDVFAIIEEMTSVSRCLFERQKILAEFSRSSSPPIESEVILSSEIGPMYAPFQNESNNELHMKDEDDSEDETLIIAEDDHVNDSTCDGIEIDKFNSRDTNDSYASPAYTKSLTQSSGDYGQFSHRVANESRTKLDDSLTQSRPKTIFENENQTKSSNSVRFQFYKENLQLEDKDASAKALSPFDSIWNTIESLYVKSSPMVDDFVLVPCDKSVTHLAFFHTKRKKDSNRQYFKIEQDKIAHIETLITEYLDDVRKNEYVAVKNFKISANASPITIAISLTNMVVKNSSRRIKELMVILGYLSNLCVDLEIDYKDFLSIMQTSLKNRIFTKTWPVDKNSDTNQVTCIIAMSILFTMLSQRSHDVKSVKNLLLEGLCSWKYRGHPVAFGVLTACPTIFNDVSRNCLLTRVILFTLINHSMQRNLALYKVSEVREMINQYYNVRLGDKAAEDYVKEAMLLFNDDTWVDAVVLLCKRKEFSWAYTNVVMKYLVQIVNKWKECDFNEIILIKTIKALHRIVQCCPSKAMNNLNKTKEKPSAVPKYHTYNIGSIIESLSEVLHGPKGSRELRETVAVAICNISHLNFQVCSKVLSEWKPPEDAISNHTLEEMNEILKRYQKMNPYVSNKWLQLFLPNECVSKKNINRRNFTPRTFERASTNGGDSTLHQQRQRHSRSHVENGTTNEPPKKKKKNKNKGKKNRDSREQSTRTET